MVDTPDAAAFTAALIARDVSATLSFDEVTVPAGLLRDLAAFSEAAFCSAASFALTAFAAAAMAIL